MLKTELYFGRTIGTDGFVTDEQWENFVNKYIIPRFPTGFSIVDIAGRWKSPDGIIISEQSKILILVHDNTNENDEKIKEVIRQYKSQFSQDSVMLVEYEVNVIF